MLSASVDLSLLCNIFNRFFFHNSFLGANGLQQRRHRHRHRRRRWRRQHQLPQQIISVSSLFSDPELRLTFSITLSFRWSSHFLKCRPSRLWWTNELCMKKVYNFSISIFFLIKVSKFVYSIWSKWWISVSHGKKIVNSLRFAMEKRTKIKSTEKGNKGKSNRSKWSVKNLTVLILKYDSFASQSNDIGSVHQLITLWTTHTSSVHLYRMI